MVGNRSKKPGEINPNYEIEKISSKKWQVRFNFIEIADVDDNAIMSGDANNNNQAMWQYDYIEVNNLLPKTIKVEIIKSKYDFNDEISIINEKEINSEKYAEYQKLRDVADLVIKMVKENESF